MPAEGEPLLRCKELSKTYISGGRELTVIKGLSFVLHAGERVAIVGESGSGKSTLLHLLGGLDRPTSGQIFYGAQEISSLSPSALAGYRNKEIGFVWQIHYLLPEFTALENAAMPLLIAGEGRAEAYRRARASLDAAGLGERADHRAGELSGGEQQRVVLARALVNRPRLLLADEPTGNLDTSTGERIVKLIGELHRRHGLTSILVTHNLAFAAGCDRVLRMQGGALSLAA